MHLSIISSNRESIFRGREYRTEVISRSGVVISITNCYNRVFMFIRLFLCLSVACIATKKEKRCVISSGISDILSVCLSKCIYTSRVPCTKVLSQSTSGFGFFIPFDRSRRARQACDVTFSNFATQEKL